MRYFPCPLLVLALVFTAACTAPAEFDTRLQAEQVVDHGLSLWPTDRVPFDWIPTVFYFGVHRTHALSAEPQHHQAYADWIAEGQRSFEGASPEAFVSSDSLSPAVLASIALREDPSGPGQPVVDAAHRYLETIPRTSQGAMAHWGQDFAWGTTTQVWLDSQFMLGMFWLAEYERTGNASHLDTWVEQHDLVWELCGNASAGLLHHAYDDATGLHIPEEPTFWLRGNSWVLAAGAAFLETAPSEHPDRERIRARFLDLALTLASHQDDTGLWRTVIDDPHPGDPANYLETSGSALVGWALAIGLRTEDLDADPFATVLQRTVRGVLSEVDLELDGTVEVSGTSMGTNPGDYDNYVGVSTRDDLMLGYGAVAMLLADAHGIARPR